MGSWAEHWPERTIQVVDGTGVLVEVAPDQLTLRFYVPQAQEPHFTVRFTREAGESFIRLLPRADLMSDVNEVSGARKAERSEDALDTGRGDGDDT